MTLNNRPKLVSLVLILFASTSLLQAQPRGTAEAKITVEVNKPGHTISPTLFGIFFEDINLSADGGIYPELIRSFAKDRNGEALRRCPDTLVSRKFIHRYSYSTFW